MKLLRLRTESFRGVPDGEYSFVARGRTTADPVTFVTGPRGAGKSHLLSAIVSLKELVGAYGAPPARASLRRRGASTGVLSGVFLLSAEERAVAEVDNAELEVSLGLGDERPEPIAGPLRKLFERYTHDSRVGKIEVFCEGRTLPPHGDPTSEKVERALRLTSLPQKYGGLIPSIVDQALKDGIRAVEHTTAHGFLIAADAADSLEPYRVALAALLPDVRLRGVHQTSPGPSLAFEYRDRRVVDVHELSAGEKQAVLLAGTIVRIGLSHSIVLVDQPESCQPSEDQRRFVDALVGLGYDNQWIVATSSADVLRGGRRENTIVLGKAG